MRKRLTTVLMTMTGAAALDLLVKTIAEQSLMRHAPQEIIGEWFRFTLVYNQGIAFGFLATDGPGVILVSGLATLLLAVWMVHALHAGRYPLPAPWALGLLLGGAVANLLDRLGDGRVTDFIDVGIGAYRWATFNLADVFIMFGMGLLLLASYRPPPEESPGKESPDKESPEERSSESARRALRRRLYEEGSTKKALRRRLKTPSHADAAHDVPHRKDGLHGRRAADPDTAGGSGWHRTPGIRPVRAPAEGLPHP